MSKRVLEINPPKMTVATGYNISLPDAWASNVSGDFQRRGGARFPAEGVQDRAQERRRRGAHFGGRLHLRN